MLTKEILCAYAPYGVKVTNGKETVEVDINNIGDTWIAYKHGEFKLILRPLSSLTKPITHNGEMFVPAEFLCPKAEYNTEFDWKVAVTSLELAEAFKFRHVAYEIVQKLMSWHFDIFGLLESGHAINIEEVDNGK